MAELCRGHQDGVVENMRFPCAGLVGEWKCAGIDGLAVGTGRRAKWPADYGRAGILSAQVANALQGNLQTLGITEIGLFLNRVAVSEYRNFVEWPEGAVERRVGLRDFL